MLTQEKITSLRDSLRHRVFVAAHPPILLTQRNKNAMLTQGKLTSLCDSSCHSAFVAPKIPAFRPTHPPKTFIA